MLPHPPYQIIRNTDVNNFVNTGHDVNVILVWLKLFLCHTLLFTIPNIVFLSSRAESEVKRSGTKDAVEGSFEAVNIAFKKNDLEITALGFERSLHSVRPPWADSLRSG